MKVDVTGLRPARWYWYRFSWDGVYSRTGRTRTAPRRRATPRHLRFGVVSCANLQAGWFSVYRHLARRDDLHAVLHLGDYLYEYGPGEYGHGQDNVDVRPHDPPREMVGLADYRRRHAQYKTDPDLQDQDPPSNPIPGNHGHPVTRPIPFFLAGGHPTVPHGTSHGRARTTDVAPTLTRFFGVGGPKGGYDGRNRLPR